MNSTAPIAVARDGTVAPRAERRLAAAAAEGAGDVAAAPLLQKNNQRQYQADQNVKIVVRWSHRIGLRRTPYI
jgi:hypothetical protein